MNKYLIQLKNTMEFWIINKESKTEIRHWIINHLDISDCNEYIVTDITGR